MHLANYLKLLHKSESDLADGFRRVGDVHADDADVYYTCHTLAGMSDVHAEKLKPFVDRYGDAAPEEPERLHHGALGEARSGGIGLLRDLLDLHMMVSTCDITWTVMGQTAQGVGDRGLLEVVHSCEGDTVRQRKWLTTRIKQSAPQALIMAP